MLEICRNEEGILINVEAQVCASTQLKPYFTVYPPSTAMA